MKPVAQGFFAFQSLAKVIVSLESPESKNCCTNTNLTQTQCRGTESLDLHPGLGRRCIRTPSSLDSIDDFKPLEACDFTIIRYGLFINCWLLFWMVDLYVKIVYQEITEESNRTIIPSFTHFLSLLLLVCSFLPSFTHSVTLNAWIHEEFSWFQWSTWWLEKRQGHLHTFPMSGDIQTIHPAFVAFVSAVKTPRRASELHWALRIGSWLSQQWRMHTFWRVACAVAYAQPARNLTQLAVSRRIDWMILLKTA